MLANCIEFQFIMVHNKEYEDQTKEEGEKLSYDFSTLFQQINSIENKIKISNLDSVER